MKQEDTGASTSGETSKKRDDAGISARYFKRRQDKIKLLEAEVLSLTDEVITLRKLVEKLDEDNETLRGAST